MVYILIIFFIWTYFNVLKKPMSKELLAKQKRKQREKNKIDLWVEKHKAVAQYNRKRNRTRSKEYGGKYRHRYDGY